MAGTCRKLYLARRIKSRPVGPAVIDSTSNVYNLDGQD